MRRNSVKRMRSGLHEEVGELVQAALVIPGRPLPDRKKRKVERVLKCRMDRIGAEITCVLARRALEQSQEDEAVAWDLLQAAHTTTGEHLHDPLEGYEESVDELRSAQSHYDGCRSEVEKQQLRLCQALEDIGAARCQAD